MALTFNGTSSKLEGANLITAYPFSMFCWIRPNSLTTDQMVMGVGDFGGATEAAMFAVGATAGDPLRAHSRTTGGSSSFATSGTGMASATWQPCLVVFRSTTSRTVYFDSGAPVTNTATNALGFGNFDRFVIGERPISATLRANMDIAHAAVWSDELGPDDWFHLRLGAVPDQIKPWALIDYWSLTASAATQTGVNSTVLTATDTATAGTSPTMGQDIPDTAPVRTNGIWTWFSEPRAVYYNGATYLGWVSSTGDVGVTKYVHSTKIRSSFTLAAALHIDDHCNATVYVRPDGRLIAFYSRHNDTSGLRYRVSTNAEDIGAWGAEQYLAGTAAYSGVNYLSGNDRLYVHYRVSSASQHYAYSDDDGATWSTPTELFYRTSNRPYVRSYNNGTDTINYISTDGHPGEVTSSIYHCRAQLIDGVLKFFTTDGGTELTPPIDVLSCTKIYDASGVSGWHWDARDGADGHPRVLFTRTVTGGSDLRYCFTRWTGSAWTTPVEITTAGDSLYAGEPSYAGGICFDADDTDTVYLAKVASGKSDIEIWGTSDSGATWAKTGDLTTGAPASTFNMRPIAPRNAATGMKLLRVRGTYTSYTGYSTDIYFEPGASGEPALTIAGTEHGHTLEAVTLSTAVTLSIASMSHGHTIDSPTLSADMALAVGGMEHGHTIDNVTLDTTSALAVADMEHGHSVESPTLTADMTIAAAGMEHQHTIESPTLSADMGLAVAGLEHASTIDNVTLTGSGGNPVIALLHMDGTAGSTTFTDETGSTWTPSAATIETDQSKFGGASGRFAWLSGGHIARAHSAALNFGSNPHTIEFFVYAPVLRAGGRGLVSRRTSAVYCPFELNVNGLGELSVLFSNSTNDGWAIIDTYVGVALAATAWTHIAWVFTGTGLELYVGGTKASNTLAYTAVTDSTQGIYFGRGGDGGADVYIDEVRIMEGAVYTENFTPPSAPFTLDDGDTLSISDTSHGLTLEAQTLTADLTLIAADTTHQHTIDNVDLELTGSLVVADMEHAHTIDAVTLSADLNLAVADTVHAHTADNLTLESSEPNLAVAGMEHPHTIDNVTLQAAMSLVVAGMEHPHTIDNVTLSAALDLIVAGMEHPHTIDAVELVSGLALTVQDMTHAHTVAGLTLETALSLAINDALHGHTLDAVALETAVTLLINDVLHAHTIDGPAIYLPTPVIEELRRSVFVRVMQLRTFVRVEQDYVFAQFDNSQVFTRQ